MDNLTLIIKAEQENIYKYLDSINIFLKDNNTQLIIINNDIKKIDTEYGYSIYEYEKDYYKFKEFCFSIATSDNILIIEDGIILSEKVVDSLYHELNNSSCSNLEVTLKRYIDKEKSSYYEQRKVLIYNTKTDDIKHLDLVVDDESLNYTDNTYIEKNICDFLSMCDYKNLELWYINIIRNLSKEKQNEFYRVLEMHKIKLCDEVIEQIENLFINNKDNYGLFIKIKTLHNLKSKNYINEIVDILKSSEFKKEEIYFAYFLLDAFRSKELITQLFKILSEDLIETYMQYLFLEHDEFHNYVYDYMISIDLPKEISKLNNNNIYVYNLIIKIYQKYMKDSSADVEKKQKLVQLFVDYTNYGLYIKENEKLGIKNHLSSNEKTFLNNISRAIEYIDKNKVDKAIFILNESKQYFPLMSRAVEYYIQRLRVENRKYPYKLSICMIAKDEEKNLDRCLSSLKPLLDNDIAELVFVDTGSTDNTINIAKKYTENIYIHPWQGSFSEARNYNISLAKGEYIFIMDADEEIMKEEINKIIKEFSSDEYKKYNTFSFKLKNFSDVECKKFSIMTQNLIFRNDGTFYYSGNVHNQPIYKAPVKHLDVNILHYGYIMTDDIKDKKFNRTATLLKKELERDPKNLYYRYQLSVSYSMHGDNVEALEQVEIYMKEFKAQSKHNNLKYKYNNLMLYNNAAIIYINNGKYEKAIEICDEALKIKDDFIDFIYYKSFALHELKEYCKAEIYLKDYLKLLDDFSNHDIINDDKFLFYSLDSRYEAQKMLISVYYNTGKYDKCISVFEQLGKDYNVKFVMNCFISSCFKIKKYDSLFSFYRNVVLNSKIDGLKDIFTYLTEYNLSKVSKEEQKDFIIQFANCDIEDDYIDVLKIRAGNSVKQDPHRVLHFIDKYEIENADYNSAKMIMNTVLPILEQYNVNSDSDLTDIKSLKKSARFILNRTLNFKQFTNLSKEYLLGVLDKYINLCIFLVNINREDMLDNEEISFLSNLLDAFKELQKGNKLQAVRYIRDSVLQHKEMAKPIELLLENIIPDFKGNSDYEQAKAENELKEYGKQIKVKIEELINNGDLDNAVLLINEYQDIIKNDVEVYTFRAIIEIIKNNLDEAEGILKEGLSIDSNDFDLNYNLGYLYEQKNIYSKSIKHYRKAAENCSDYNLKEEINKEIEKILNEYQDVAVLDRKKIVFFDKGGDKFIWDIINELSKEYETKHIRVTDYKQIDEGMKWADICWFEWCDELIAYGSKLPLAKEKKIICRIHGYEVYTNFINQPDWKNINDLIIVAPHIKRIFEENTKYIDKGGLKVHMIFCGINVNRYPLNMKNKGFNLGYLGYINYKKNIPLTLDIFKKLHDVDSRYKLFIAGEFQDMRTLSYFKYFINEYELNNSVFFDGWKNEEQKIEWFKKIDYMLISSIDEGLCFAAAEAMCSGIKPVLHNCEGIKDHYDKKYIFDTIDEATDMITCAEYDSKEYREFIKDNYSLEKECKQIKEIIKN